MKQKPSKSADRRFQAALRIFEEAAKKMRDVLFKDGCRDMCGTQIESYLVNRRGKLYLIDVWYGQSETHVDELPDLRRLVLLGLASDLREGEYKYIGEQNEWFADASKWSHRRHRSFGLPELFIDTSYAEDVHDKLEYASKTEKGKRLLEAIAQANCYLDGLEADLAGAWEEYQKKKAEWEEEHHKYYEELGRRLFADMGTTVKGTGAGETEAFQSELANVASQLGGLAETLGGLSSEHFAKGDDEELLK